MANMIWVVVIDMDPALLQLPKLLQIDSGAAGPLQDPDPVAPSEGLPVRSRPHIYRGPPAGLL